MFPCTVLLVDPHADCRIVYATFLAHHGYRVIQALDDEEGVQLARTQRPDLILTELFPWSAGGKLLPERLREIPETAGIPVVVLTAHLLAEEWSDTLIDCSCRVLIKPCGPRHVLEEIRHLAQAA